MSFLTIRRHSHTKIMSYIYIIERALRLTAISLKYNPANYTVWRYRRSVLSFLSNFNDDDSIQKYDPTGNNVHKFDPKLVRSEMDFVSKIGGSNPKNYQIWYHRRILLEYYCLYNSQCEYIKSELNYIATVLEEDGKNYHAWSNRQWIVKTISQNCIWMNEKIFVREKISQDCRNNSAWNYLWFLNYHNDKKEISSKGDTYLAQEEVDYALSILIIDIYNESPWRYMLSVLKNVKSLDLITKYLSKITEIKNSYSWSNEGRVSNNASEDVISSVTFNNGVSVELLSAQIELWEMRGTHLDYRNAAESAHELGVIYDTIRSSYWLLKEKEFRRKIDICEE